MGAKADQYKDGHAYGATGPSGPATPLGSGSGETARNFSVNRLAPAFTDSQVSNPNRAREERAKNEKEQFYESDISKIANASPQQRSQINQALISAGMLDDDTPLGGWGKNNADALREVYGLANQLTDDYGGEQPTSFYFSKAISLLMEGKPPASAAARVPPVRLSSEADLRKVLTEASEKTLGRRLSPDEETKFVQYFHGQEQSFGTAARDQSGGTLVEPPSAGVAAEQFAENAAPAEAGAQDLSGQLGTLRKLLGG